MQKKTTAVSDSVKYSAAAEPAEEEPAAEAERRGRGHVLAARRHRAEAGDQADGPVEALEPDHLRRRAADDLGAA